MRGSRYCWGLLLALLLLSSPSWAGGGRVDQGGSGKGTFDAGNCGASNMEPPCLTIVPTGVNTATFESDGTPLYSLFQIDISNQPATYTLALNDGVNDTWGSWLCGGEGGAPTTFCTNVPDCTVFGNCAVQGNDSTSQFFSSIVQNGNSVVFTFNYGTVPADVTSWTFYDTFSANTAVPEPATLSLMAAGMGLVGFVRRRRAIAA